MADPECVPVATIHSNRRKPLLSEFPLKPGRVTIARFSQSNGQQRLVVGGGEMLREPLAFSGTAGVIRFDTPVPQVLDTIMTEGLEHHYGLVYGDVRAALFATARSLGIKVVML
jgi:L-fucose isomerase-like protein